MKPKVSVYIATSLDGFIARSNGDIDWLEIADELVPEGEDLGYADFMQSVDVLVMGRNSYEKVLTFGEWPYEKPVIVLSSQPIMFPKEIPETVTHSSASPAELCAQLALDGVSHVYIDGGKTIQRFLNAGLVDEMIITKIPVILGDGIPLFGPTPTDIRLKMIDVKAYDFGLVQLKYAVTSD